MARRARCGWVRSVLTQEVKAIAAASPRIDAACPKLTSGQLPFPGSTVALLEGALNLALTLAFLDGVALAQPEGAAHGFWHRGLVAVSQRGFDFEGGSHGALQSKG